MTTFEIYEKFKREQWNEDHSGDYVVCVCAKNEDDYIEEWIEHYLKLGFDKIVLADNNDKDTLSERISRFIEDGTVYLVNCRNNNAFFQVQFYSLFCADSNFKWCAFFDVDEFLEIYNDSIKSLLGPISEDVVCFNWLLFDSNGERYKKEGKVVDRFKLPLFPVAMTMANMFFKSIVHGGRKETFKGCKFNGSHLPYNDLGNITYNHGGHVTSGLTNHTCYPIRYKFGYLKHYYTKSLEEFLAKASRGWPDGAANFNNGYFFCLNSVTVPIQNFTKTLFCNLSTNDSSGILNDYDVIQVKHDGFIYAFVKGLSNLMEQTTGHTFVISDETEIDDTLFAICLENAFKTGNRLVYCKREDLWKTFLKYRDGRNNTYYILTFF